MNKLSGCFGSNDASFPGSNRAPLKDKAITTISLLKIDMPNKLDLRDLKQIIS